MTHNMLLNHYNNEGASIAGLYAECLGNLLGDGRVLSVLNIRGLHCQEEGGSEHNERKENEDPRNSGEALAT